MAIKYVCLPEKKQTIAYFEKDTTYDAVDKIEKVLSDTNVVVFPQKKYLMPRSFRAIVTCVAPDVYNEEEGKKQAREKLLRNYRRSVHKRMAWFVEDLEKALKKFKEKA